MSEAFLRASRPFLEAGILAEVDVRSVALAAPRFGEADVRRMLGLAFAVRAPRHGHAGVVLSEVRARLDDDGLARASKSSAMTAAGLDWPEPRGWEAAVARSPMVGGADDHERPFALQTFDDGQPPLLLTRRMYAEQSRVAAALAAFASEPSPPLTLDGEPGVEALMQRFFPDSPEGEAARAVRTCLERRCTVIVGGPGTGKTFSISRLLGALSAARPDAPPRIALAAPTGKAAARMREAIAETLAPDAATPLPIDATTREQLAALPALTLHRLLGIRPDGTPRANAARPLPYELVVVDEVSMVDLALMRKLLEAIGPTTRLVLLGDRDQLASVEAGCVLADVVGSEAGPLAPMIVRFTKSRRFASAPDIALVAACLQSQVTPSAEVPSIEDARLACATAVMEGALHASAERHPHARIERLGAPAILRPGRPPAPSEAQLDALARPYLEGVDALLLDGTVRRLPSPYALLAAHLAATEHGAPAAISAGFARTLLAAFDHYRVLAVHRRGPLGVGALDRAIGQRVRATLPGIDESFERATSPAASERGEEGSEVWPGRPILVTENAPEVGLANGDVGMYLPSDEGLVAFFPHEKPGEVRKVGRTRLPAHQGAFAMTVHKSQGSQFDAVALVLAGRSSPIETRELVYTGITRAKGSLRWLGSAEELRAALGRRVERASGLAPLIGAAAERRGERPSARATTLPGANVDESITR
jgi:exodeoxyribonuclease V alpha subunit